MLLEKVLFDCGVNNPQIIESYNLLKSNQTVENEYQFWKLLIDVLPNVIYRLDSLDESINTEISVDITYIDKIQLYRHYLSVVIDRISNDMLTPIKNQSATTISNNKLLLQYIIDKLYIIPRENHSAEDVQLLSELDSISYKFKDIMIFNSLNMLFKKYQYRRGSVYYYEKQQAQANAQSQSVTEISKVTSEYIQYIVNLFNLEYLDDEYVPMILNNENLVKKLDVYLTGKPTKIVLNELIDLRELQIRSKNQIHLRNYSFINNQSLLLSIHSILVFYIRSNVIDDIKFGIKKISDRKVTTVTFNTIKELKTWIKTLGALLASNQSYQQWVTNNQDDKIIFNPLLSEQ